MSIVFFADATADIPAEYLKEHENVQILGMRYTIGDAEGIYTVADNQEQLDDFYKRMREGEKTSTSMILYEEAYQAFEPFFAKGCDIIYFGLLLELSAQHVQIEKAGNDLAEKYGRKFYAPNTKSITVKNYSIVRYAVEFEKKYADLPDCFERVKAEIDPLFDNIVIYFTIGDLKYLHRSGRLSATRKLIGNLLNIKPIIHIDLEKAKLVPLAKKAGRLPSIQYIANLIKQPRQNPEIWLLHADCPDDAEILKQKVLEIDPDAKVIMKQIGVIVGLHGGPGTVGLGFVKKYLDKPDALLDVYRHGL